MNCEPDHFNTFHLYHPIRNTETKTAIQPALAQTFENCRTLQKILDDLVPDWQSNYSHLKLTLFQFLHYTNPSEALPAALSVLPEFAQTALTGLKILILNHDLQTSEKIDAHFEAEKSQMLRRLQAQLKI